MSTQNQINVLDLFCGAGGFSAGLEMADKQYNVVGGIDTEEDAIATFEKNHNNAKGFVRDLSQTNPSSIENELQDDINMIIGGPPCKGFSSIRPNRSSDEIDYRNYLYRDYLRFVKHFQPEVFIMENVPEIINHKIKGEPVLDMIESEIKNLGYDYEWKLLNSAFYGVPQARTRFILIGVRDSQEISFPEPTHYFEDKSVESGRLRYGGSTLTPTDESKLDNLVVTVEEAFSDLPEVGAGERNDEYNCLPQNEFQEEMRENAETLSEHRATNHSEKTLRWLENAGTSRKAFEGCEGPPSGYGSTYCRLYRDEPATTVTTEYVTAGASRSLHPDEKRALTVREGMRLQSFPDCYEFEGAKTSIVEQVGNAVPPLLAKAIGTEVISLCRTQIVQ